MEKFSETANTIAEERYANIREDGTKETLHDIFVRVSTALAKEDKKYLSNNMSEYDKVERIAELRDNFLKLMVNKKLIPAGRTLANAGCSDLVANCVVLPIEDSMDSIGETLHNAMLLQQQGCGLGFDFSDLRPAGFETKRSRGVASGPVSFMKIYDSVFSTIKQQGRHGANMGILRIDHPDIIDFIQCKRTEGDINNFNISVAVTDDFMNLLYENPDELWIGMFKGNYYPLRDVDHVKDMFGAKEVVTQKEYTVKEVWDLLCESAHINGEPGVIFIDTVNKTNPLPGLGPIVASNPCGENMLHAYDNCNLLSINLNAFFIENEVWNQQIDWEGLSVTVKYAIRMLDNTIDLFKHSVKEIDDMAKANRRVGLGVMGFADLLMRLKIRYGSELSYEVARSIMRKIQNDANEESALLAEDRGSFDNIDKSIYKGKMMRNAARTSIAPTGSISMLFDVNSGIEPYFDLAYTKKIRAGEFTYVAPPLLDFLNKEFEPDTVAHIVDLLGKGNILRSVLSSYTPIGDDDKTLDVFRTSMDISWDEHLDMQSIFQDYTDNSISKTINMPYEATIDSIAEAYCEAWGNSCKSVTVYRDNSRKDQILNVMAEKPAPDHQYHGIIPRPRLVNGYTDMIETAHGKMYVTVNGWEYNGEYKNYEVFALLGKEGGDVHSYISAITRMISLSLRSGVSEDEIIDQLRGISCHTVWDQGERNEGPVDALAIVLERNNLRMTNLKKVASEVMETLTNLKETIVEEQCSKCNATSIIRQDGCEVCKNCGWSRC